MQLRTVPTASLFALWAEHRTELQGDTFGEPLHLISPDTGNRLQADVYAELCAPFATVSTLLRSADSACGVLFLHLNVRACVVQRGDQGDVLVVTGGPKQGNVVWGYDLQNGLHQALRKHPRRLLFRAIA